MRCQATDPVTRRACQATATHWIPVFYKHDVRGNGDRAFYMCASHSHWQDTRAQLKRGETNAVPLPRRSKP